MREQRTSGNGSKARVQWISRAESWEQVDDREADRDEGVEVVAMAQLKEGVP